MNSTNALFRWLGRPSHRRPCNAVQREDSIAKNISTKGGGSTMNWKHTVILAIGISGTTSVSMAQSNDADPFTAGFVYTESNLAAV